MSPACLGNSFYRRVGLTCAAISVMTAETSNAPAPLSIVVAANVRAEAARRGLTQAKMAALLGMSRMAMSDRFRGRTPWTLDELEDLARKFGTTVEDLLARPKGFEPLTFWLGASEPPAVVDLGAARAVRMAA